MSKKGFTEKTFPRADLWDKRWKDSDKCYEQAYVIKKKEVKKVR